MITAETKIARCPNCKATLRVKFEDSLEPPEKFTMDCPDCGYPVQLELK